MEGGGRGENWFLVRSHIVLFSSSKKPSSLSQDGESFVDIFPAMDRRKSQAMPERQEALKVLFCSQAASSRPASQASLLSEFLCALMLDAMTCQWSIHRTQACAEGGMLQLPHSKHASLPVSSCPKSPHTHWEKSNGQYI